MLTEHRQGWEAALPGNQDASLASRWWEASTSVMG